MSFWNPIKPSPEETARLRQLYEELGSLQAGADAENVSTGWLGRLLAQHDRRAAGSGEDYDGIERRILKGDDRRVLGSDEDYDGPERRDF